MKIDGPRDFRRFLVMFFSPHTETPTLEEPDHPALEFLGGIKVAGILRELKDRHLVRLFNQYSRGREQGNGIRAAITDEVLDRLDPHWADRPLDSEGGDANRQDPQSAEG